MNCLKVCGPNKFLRSAPFSRMCTVPNNEGHVPTSTSALPEEPTTCCMSGCANCVWIDYAEQLSKLFDDGGEKTRDMVLSKVSDPNMKAFLVMELKALEKKKTGNSG